MSFNNWSEQHLQMHRHAAQAKEIAHGRLHKATYHQDMRKQMADRWGQQAQKLAVEPPRQPPKAAEASSLKFAVRGDNLMNTRKDNAAKRKKTYRTFKAEFVHEFRTAFGRIDLDYELSSEGSVSDVVECINSGPSFDILCVGICMNDLFVHISNEMKNTVVSSYPSSLDAVLVALAEAMKRKSNGSLVLVGGPAALWQYPERWDTFVAQASRTLQGAGVQVVDREAAEDVMWQMTLAGDGIHFSDDDGCKEVFAKAWVTWLHKSAAEREAAKGLQLRSELDARSGKLAGLAPEHQVLVAQTLSEKLEAARRSREALSRSRSPRAKPSPAAAAAAAAIAAAAARPRSLRNADIVNPMPVAAPPTGRMTAEEFQALTAGMGARSSQPPVAEAPPPHEPDTTIAASSSEPAPSAAVPAAKQVGKPSRQVNTPAPPDPSTEGAISLEGLMKLAGLA